MRYSPKMPPVYNANNEKVLVIGNRLANLNYKKETDLLNQSHEALESLLQANHGSNSIKKTPYSNNSLHVDSAVSISGVSQQSTPPAIGSPTPIITTHTVTAGNSISPAGPAVTAPIAPPAPTPTGPSPGPPRDDAQLVDFYSSFFFPISFVIFNIIYWMVYLNMQVESGV